VTVYAVNTRTGQPQPAEHLRSLLDGAPQRLRCPVCQHPGALMRHPETPGTLPFAHSTACPLGNAEALLATEDAEAFADQGSPTEMVISRRPDRAEIRLAEMAGHHLDPDAPVTVTLDAAGRRRVFMTNNGDRIVW